MASGGGGGVEILQQAYNKLNKNIHNIAGKIHALSKEPSVHQLSEMIQNSTG